MGEDYCWRDSDQVTQPPFVTCFLFYDTLPYSFTSTLQMSSAGKLFYSRKWFYQKQAWVATEEVEGEMEEMTEKEVRKQYNVLFLNLWQYNAFFSW